MLSVMRDNRNEIKVRERARALAQLAGLDPDSRVEKPGSHKGMPAWCQFRGAARAELTQAETVTLGVGENEKPPEPIIIGHHEPEAVMQLRSCVRTGRAVAGILCADGHLGYAQPVGGVVAYRDQVSISGVGFDIACGNAAVRLDTRADDIRGDLPTILRDITRAISFGIGRTNSKPVQAECLDDKLAWVDAGMTDYRDKAASQLGTVGSGNHYVDVFEDENGSVWIGCHFGSRGLGHTTATRYLKLAGGRDGINVPPCVVDVNSQLGQSYLHAMHLAGRYAYAGRNWVVERVRWIIGGRVQEKVHNHHNFAWFEEHEIDGQSMELCVVRKGATPAAPGQQGFVGGSMGDDAVILEGRDSPAARHWLFSTVHGAGRVMGRKAAKRTFTRKAMDEWLEKRGVLVGGGDLDESPMAYRRLPAVLSAHAESIRVLHTLRPLIVVMAGACEVDPFKD